MKTITEKQELLAAVTAGLHPQVDGFLVAKRAEGLSAGTLRKIYGPRLIHFAAQGERRDVTRISLKQHDRASIQRYGLDFIPCVGQMVGVLKRSALNAGDEVRCPLQAPPPRLSTPLGGRPYKQTPARLRVLNRAQGQAALRGSELPSDQFLFDSPTNFLMISREMVGCHAQGSNFCGHHSLLRLWYIFASAPVGGG